MGPNICGKKKKTKSLTELLQDTMQVKQRKRQPASCGTAGCVCVYVCNPASGYFCVLWMFVDLLFSRTPRSKRQPTLPPHDYLSFRTRSLLLFLHLSTPSLIKNCRPWLLIKSHLKSLKVSLRLIQFAFLNREHCLKGLINWTKKKCLLSAPCRQSSRRSKENYPSHHSPTHPTNVYPNICSCCVACLPGCQQKWKA